MKYINAERLKEILKSQIKERKEWMKDIDRSDRQDQLWSDLNGEDMSILQIIDSLQQEQSAQKKNCAGCPHCVDRKDQYGWHFKGCFGGPYKGKFIAEIDECPLQQEQPESSNGKFVFPKFLYARTVDNKTIDVSYAPQSLDAVEYIKNGPTEQPEVDLEKDIQDWMINECGPSNFNPYADHWCADDIINTARHFHELGLNSKPK